MAGIPAAAAQHPPEPHQERGVNQDPAILTVPELRLQFGRLNSTRTRVTVRINPGELSRVYAAEYQAAVHTLGGLIAVDLTEAQYIQISRTFLLKRLQDIHEHQTGIRPPAPIQLARGFEVLRPSGELLYALGPYFCDLNGKQYHLTYPAAPNVDPPAWYALDAAILGRYRLFIDLVKNRYDLITFPKMSDMNGHPLMFTRGEEANDYKVVRASLNIPQPSDAFLRFVHEDGFIETAVPAFADCSLIMTESLLIDDVVQRYTHSYVRGVHV